MGKVGTSRHILEKVGTWEKQAQIGTFFRESRHKGKVGTGSHSLEKQAHGKSRHKQAQFRKEGTW